jgi:uncharacterized protein YlxP (DUF503 family)
MFIGTCLITLHIPFAGTLKEKRSIVKSIIARVRNEFNVSVAEVDMHDIYSQTVIGVASVSTSQNYIHGQLEKVVQFIEKIRPDTPIVDYQIEIL